MDTIQFPISTGQVCRLLETPEHRVLNPIRQAKLFVPNIGGRRLWSAEHVLTVAKILGKDSPTIRNLCTVAPASKPATPPPAAPSLGGASM